MSDDLNPDTEAFLRWFYGGTPPNGDWYYIDTVLSLPPHEDDTALAGGQGFSDQGNGRHA